MTAPVVEWDEDLVPGFTDATCQIQGIETEVGNPDAHGLFSAGTAVIQLDNTSGDWSQYDADGGLAGRGPGYELAIWARYRDGSEWWIFDGTISRWDDLGDIVEVEAFDAFADLAQQIGTYTPGVNGQAPGPRCEAILTAAGSTAIPHVFATGDVTLTAQPTDAAPLEELQAVTSSDGGAVFVDADGTLRSTRRTWRNGRADQTAVPVAAANVCTADIVVWDAVLSTNDDFVADTVVLENVAKLRAQAPAGQPIGRFVFTDTDQQWTTQVEGDTLAAFTFSNQQAVRVNVEAFDLYLYDPQQPNLYHAVEWRLFDLLRFLHNYRAVGGADARLDMNTIITTIAHSIVPFGNWVMSVGTTKAVGSNQLLFWNPAGDPYVWNTPGAIWGYA
jgi:hypothetical protein